VDATHGTTHYDWPLFTPCVLNSDQKIRPIGYCLVDSEYDLSQSWMLSSILEIEPAWFDLVENPSYRILLGRLRMRFVAIMDVVFDS
jgi:hypothetical protein